jgi:hypothetical protein
LLFEWGKQEMQTEVGSEIIWKVATRQTGKDGLILQLFNKDIFIA